MPGQAEAPTPQVSNQFPIYFAGGLGYDAARNQGVTDYIAGLGHDVAPVLADPDVGAIDTGFRMVINGVDREVTQRAAYGIAYKPNVGVSIANFQQQRADELLRTFETESVPKVDAIFQSADALNGLLAAKQEPDRFNSIVLAYPAGIVRQPDIRRAAPKVLPLEALVRLKPEHRAAKRAHDFEGKRTKARRIGGFTVASSVGLSQQSRLLHEMRQGEDAPGVALVVGSDDIMLSPQKVFAGLESSDDVDLVLVTKTPHGISGRDDIMQSIVDLFPKLEEVKQARQIDGLTRVPLAERVLFSGDFKASHKDRILQQAVAVDARSA